MDCISEQDLDEMNIEIIRNTLYKVGIYKYAYRQGTNLTSDIKNKVIIVDLTQQHMRFEEFFIEIIRLVVGSSVLESLWCVYFNVK